ncbi:hypothetical protein GCM10007092_18480 [Thermus composti]|uniref:DUF444 family protein n=1 Tax=Thermus composti TaxID=532059 RepID=A0ABV6PYH4_9DEIN|nr:DUF444 family protein [Thermus composti]GGN04252.1 hypothetical protein GCM10007092_18480 [Thermus composti]
MTPGEAFLPIERDLQRFKEIVRGEVKKRAREFLTREELFGQVEGRLVSIPLPQLEIPKIVYGEPLGEGLGLGGPGDEALGPGGHIPVAELELEEFLDLVGEALRLPRLRPKGEGEVTEEAFRYTTLARKGPRGLRHVRRTLKESLKRALLSGEYRPEVPLLVPEPEDLRYKAPKKKPRPHAQAVVLFALDVSGSMREEELRLVKTLSFWITLWIKRHFPKLERRYLLHDAEAWEVSEEEFFKAREGGGTRLSSALLLAEEILKAYPEAFYNRYLYHFSDGENWQGDTPLALEALKRLLPSLALYGYAQVEGPYGRGQFFEELAEALGGQEGLALAEVRGREDLPRALRQLLGG